MIRKLAVAFALVVAVGFSGCSAKTNQAVVTANTAVHDALISFDNALDAKCDAGNLTPETCKSLNSILDPVWGLKNDLNRMSRDRNFDGLTAKVQEFKTKVDELIAAVQKSVNDGQGLAMLLRELNLSKEQVPAVR